MVEMKLISVVLTTITLGHFADGHGHLVSPRSLNFDAAKNGAMNKAGVPPIDYCPHCLNQAKGPKICGFNSYNNYDDFRDSQGNPMPWISAAEYSGGQIIDVKSYLDTHHNGHMEIRACPDGEASTLQCFDTPGNALTFVEDVMWGMPADPAYPERGMYYGGQGGAIKDFHMRFKLPDHIVGNQVMLQWKYITANSCSPPGYAAYFANNNLPSSFWTAGVRLCSPPYPSDGTRSDVWPEQFFNCARISVIPAGPTNIPAPTTPPASKAPTVSTPLAVPTDVSTPTWGQPTGQGCCSMDFKTCVTWCGVDKNGCDTCNNNEAIWLANGPPNMSCAAKYADCTANKQSCCPGLSCVADSQYYAQCRFITTSSPNPATPTMTTPPPTTQRPTNPPTPVIPTFPPTTRSPIIPVNGNLFRTTETLSAWDAFLQLDTLTFKVSNNPPLYALQAAGGAAGSGNVVSESQAYAVFITAVVLASWETHKKASLTDADWNLAVTYFEGYFNGWKRMCLNSNKFSGCQSDGTWCKDSSTGQRGICLPGWKHKGDLSAELGTGAAPDGDEDAIVGMIMAIKAFENKTKPSWYDDLRKWADASCTAFLNYNTVVDATSPHRIVKLGSCWGGWGSNGNNPSYHSPGSYKVMRDFHVAFPASDRDYTLPNFGSGTLKGHWDQLIATSYASVSALQCPEQGMVPNWGLLTVQNGNVKHFPGSFSGSGTPQWEYGAEAARLTWRVAIDAAMYPSEFQDKAKPFLDPLLNRLRTGYNPNLSFNEKYFSADTFTQCTLPETTNAIYKFSGGWVWNAFIFAPTISALVVPITGESPSVQQQMIDAAGSVLASNIPNDYYSRCWTIIGILTLNGAIQSAGMKLASQSPSIQTTGIPCCSNNLKDCIFWECNGCHESEQKCTSQSGFFWMPWGEVLDDNTCIAITYSCDGHKKPCCPGMICDPSYPRPGPCIVAPKAPTAKPTNAPLATPSMSPTVAITPTLMPVLPAPTSIPNTPSPTTVTPVAMPVQPTIAPIQPTAAPIQPTVAPIQPTVAPIQPTAAPIQPTAAPMQPTPKPVTPTPAPTTAPPTKAPQVPSTLAPTSGVTTSNGIPLPCCSWNGNSCEQPGNTWCHAVSTQCTGACNGKWITGAVSPTLPPTNSTGAGCCTWGGWSTCPSWTQNSQDTCQMTVSGCQGCFGTWISA